MIYSKHTKISWATLSMALAIMLSLTGCKNSGELTLNGYIEAEPILVASSQSGALVNLTVSKGAWAKPGQLLFILEQENELAQVAEAKAKYQRLIAILEDNTKGKRPEERAALQAELNSAQASLTLSEIELKRQANLIKSGYTSKSNLDILTAQRDQNLAKLSEISAQIKLAALGIRENLLDASHEDVKMAKAQLAQAQWRLDQKNIKLLSPLGAQARIEDIFFRIGEWVPAGSPVIKLQDPHFIKVRFFIPEALLPKIKLGQKLRLSCDGCANRLSATVHFIASQAEFTPPVIFSQENRNRLVFMVEATPTPTQAIYFKAGQPIQIHLSYLEQEA